MPSNSAGPVAVNVNTGDLIYDPDVFTVVVPGTNPLRAVPVANNTYVAATDVNRTTTGTSRKPHVIGVACSDIRFVYCNWANNGVAASPNNNDIDSSGSLNIKASVEIGGTIYRLTFGGATTATIDPGGWVATDTLPVELAAGTTIYSRTFMGASSNWHYNGYSGFGVGQGGWVVTTDLTAPGAAAVADSSSSILYVPAAIVGIPAANTRSVLIVGDSIANGYGDQPGTVAFQGRNTSAPQLAGGGFIARALYGSLGHLNASMPGDTVQSFVTLAGHFRRMAWASSCTTVICEYGRNDVSAARTAAQIEADLMAAWLIGSNRGLRVFQTTITPSSTSTDNWQTTANQTTAATNVVRIAVNAWIRAGGPVDPATKVPVAVNTAGALLAGGSGHPLYGWFEAADLVESARDSGIFKAWANSRTVADAAITATASTLTSATAAFTSADLGRRVLISGAGTAGAVHAASITTINSTTSVAVTPAAVTTVSGASATLGDAYTPDGTHLAPYGAAAAAAGITVASI